jgi:hypothetical protein
MSVHVSGICVKFHTVAPVMPCLGTQLHASVRYESWPINLFVNKVDDGRRITGAASDFSIVSIGYYAVIVPPRMFGLSLVNAYLESVAKQIMASHAQSGMKVIPTERRTYS